jgi:predicted Zn-dependent peptidase
MTRTWLLSAAAATVLFTAVAGAAQRPARTKPKPAAQAQPPAPAPAPAPAAPFPSSPPAPGTPKDFRVPEPKRFTLPNGLEVAMVQWGNTPKVTFSLTVRSGNAFEKPDEVWLADLTGNLMQEGTTTRDGQAISREAARMGGDLTISVGGDTTTVVSEVLSEFAPKAVELVADVVQHPRFPESELPRLKADLTRQLDVARSQPGQLALEKFRAVLYPNQPFGRVFPTADMIKGYTLEQAKAFYQANFGAGRSRLYVVGRFDAATLEPAIRKAFEGWDRGTPAEAPVPKPVSSRSVYLIDRPGAVQSTLIVGIPTVDPTHADFIPVTVMNALLGGSFGSRITKNIREDKGYTYSPFSQLSTRYRDAYWAENADVTTAVTGPSLKEIFGEIDRLQADPPSAEELKGIQNYLAGTFVLRNSSRGGIIGQLAFMDLHGLPPSYANDYVKNVYAVTPEAISEAARKHLDDTKATIVVVGDRKVIEAQVKDFGTIVQ